MNGTDPRDSRLPRPPDAPAAQARQGLRNLLAVMIAAAAVGWLYVQFDPSGAPPATDVDLDQLAAELDQPAGTTPVSLSGSDDVPDLSTPPLEGRAALEYDLERLERAEQFLLQVEDYTATFYRRERIGRDLGEPDIMQLKVRHRPFSFYMKWLNGDVGREVLYVEGQNNGEMVVKLGGLKGRLLPALNINPHGAVAMRECRHPPLEVGLLGMTRRMIGDRRRDIAQSGGITCRVIPDCELQHRRCDCVVLEYDRPELSPAYRQTLHYFDRETGLPVLVKSYGWPQDLPGAVESRLDETTLVEQYAYTNLRLNVGLTDRNFDRDNPQYNFGR